MREKNFPVLDGLLLFLKFLTITSLIKTVSPLTDQKSGTIYGVPSVKYSIDNLVFRIE
jgi:hypothetical protein